MCNRVTIQLFPVLFLAITASAFSQDQAFRPVGNTTTFKRDFATESSKVRTITSDFRQEKYLTALTEKITSTGKFWFERENKVRIDYEKPFVYQLIMNGDRILIRDDQKTNRVNVRSNRLFQQVNRIMLDCVQGTILDNRDFDADVFENDKLYKIRLSPLGKGIRDFFESIELVVDRKDYSVVSIGMNEPGGDRTVMTFSNKTLNRPVDDEIFDL